MYDNPSPKEFKEFEVTCLVEALVKKTIIAKSKEEAIELIDAEDLLSNVICVEGFEVMKVDEV